MNRNTKLKELNCGNNLLTTLNVSNNTYLQKLDCSDNSLTDLDSSQNTTIRNVYCHKNLLTYDKMKLPQVTIAALYFKDTQNGDMQTLTKKYTRIGSKEMDCNVKK